MSSRLDEIKARAAAATGGPWKWDNRRVPTLNGMAGSRDVYRYETEVIEADHNGECGCRSACQLDLTVGPADAEFIAHARTDVPALVAALERVSLHVPTADTTGNVCCVIRGADSYQDCPMFKLGDEWSDHIADVVARALGEDNT